MWCSGYWNNQILHWRRWGCCRDPFDVVVLASRTLSNCWNSCRIRCEDWGDIRIMLAHRHFQKRRKWMLLMRAVQNFRHSTAYEDPWRRDTQIRDSGSNLRSWNWLSSVLNQSRCIFSSKGEDGTRHVGKLEQLSNRLCCHRYPVNRYLGLPSHISRGHVVAQTVGDGTYANSLHQWSDRKQHCNQIGDRELNTGVAYERVNEILATCLKKRHNDQLCKFELGKDIDEIVIPFVKLYIAVVSKDWGRKEK